MQARPTTEARSVGHHAPLHAPSEGTGVPSHFTMLLAKGIALRRVDQSGRRLVMNRFSRVAVGGALPPAVLILATLTLAGVRTAALAAETASAGAPPPASPGME